MSLLSDGGLCLDNSVTYGALLTVGKTGLGTGCCLAGNSNYGVTLSRNCLGVGVAAVYASVGLNACTLASRSGGNLACIVGVALSINSGLCYGNGATYGALLTLGKTGLGAGRSYCRDGNLGVTECGVLINNGVGNATAIVTGSGLSAVLGAGCVAIGYVVGEAVANGNSLAAADVTDCVCAIGVSVVACNDKCAKNLLSNVSVAANLCILDVNVEYVVKLKREYARIYGGDCCDKIKKVVSVNGLTCNGNNSVERSVYHSLNKSALVNDKSSEKLAGDLYGDNLCLNNLDCKFTNVGVSNGDEISNHSLCLVANGKIKGNYIVNSLVVLTKSDVGKLYDVGVDGNRLNVCKNAESGDDLAGHLNVGATKSCKSVCKIECYVVNNDVVVNVEAVVVTESCNSCIGVNSVDGEHSLVIVKIILGVSVSRGLYCKIDNVHYRNLNGEVCVLAKLSVKCAGLDHANVAGKAKLISIVIEKLNNVCGVGKYIGNACSYERIIDSALNLLNVGKVLLTNESGPVKLVNGAFNIGCKKTVDSAVKSSVNGNNSFLGKNVGQYVSYVSVKLRTKNGVNVLACVCNCLHNCIVDSGSAVVSNGDKVCASDISCGYGCHSNLLVLVSAKVKSLCDDVSVAVVAVNDCKIEGVLGKLKLAGNDACDVLLDSLYNSGEHLVDIGLDVTAVNEGVNSRNKLVSLCVSCCNNSLNLCDSSRNLSVDYYDSCLKLCYCSVELSLCICDCSCKLSLNLCDSCLKLCLYSCDLCKDSCLCLANCCHKLLVKNVELILSLCNKSIDLKLCLCLESENIGSSVYDCDLKECLNVVYVSGKSCKKLVNLYEGLCVECICIVNKSSYSIDSSLCICEGVRKSGSELYALDVLGILSNPSLCEVNVALRIVKVCVDHIDHAGLNSLSISYLVSLVIILKNEVSKDSEILNSLVLCGVVGLIRLYDSSKEIVVTCGSGVNGHTVTNLEERVDLAHGKCGLRTGEPAYKRVVDVVRSGALGKDLGHGAKCAKKVAACNAKKTVNGDIHGVNAFYDRSLKSKVDNDGDLLLKLVRVSLSRPSSSVCEGIISGECGQVCHNHRKRRGICAAHKLCDLFCKLLCNKIGVGSVVFVGAELVVSNLIKSNGGKRLAKNKSTDHACKALVVSVNASLTNDVSGKSVVINVLPVVVSKIIKRLNDELGLGLSCIVELCILILACKLLCGGNSCDVSVKKSEHIVHHIADSDRLHALSGDLHTVGGIHKTNEHDLYVGVHLNDSVDNALVVDKEACGDVSNCIAKFNNLVSRCYLCGDNCKKLFHSGVVDLKNELASLLGLKKLKRHIKGNYLFLGKRGAHNAEITSDVLYHIRTEGSVTDAKSDDVCILNCCLVVCGECIYVVNVGVVENLAEPTVGGHLAATKEVKKILCAERGNCELGVLYVAVLLEILLKLQCIRSFAVNTLSVKEVDVFGTLLISLKSVSVSHRIADGNVMDFLVLGNAVDTSSESGSSKAKEHCACHDQSKNLRTYFFHIHIFSLSDTFSCQ